MCYGNRTYRVLPTLASKEGNGHVPALTDTRAPVHISMKPAEAGLALFFQWKTWWL